MVTRAMQEDSHWLDRLLGRARLLRYKLFGRGPSDAEWEVRVRRVVQETVQTALPWIPAQGAQVLDIGANIGLFTEEILKSRPDARVWMFEPVHSHHAACVRRFASNPRVRVESFALGDRNFAGKIWKPKHNPGGNVIDEEIVERRRGFMDFRPEEIEVRTFDDYAREQGIERIDFIKSDTEGYDHRVLRGILPFLERTGCRPPIIAELLREDIHPEYASQTEVLEALYRLGYERVDLSGMQDVQDFLFLPRGARANR